MDVALLFVLPLIGGFTFAKNFLLVRYQAAREDGQRLYYRAALFGVLFSVLGAVIHHGLLAPVEWYRALSVHVASTFLDPLFERPSLPATAYSQQAVQVRVDIAMICAWAFVLGALTFLWNALLHWGDRLYVRIRKGGSERSFLRALNLAAIKDQLELLLANSLARGTQVLITLSNGKVYVGVVLRAPDPASPLKHFRLQPFMSGYRDPETGRVKFTTFYGKVLEKPDVNVASFQLVVPVDKVITASGFDLKAYREFAAQGGDAAGALAPADAGAAR